MSEERCKILITAGLDGRAATSQKGRPNLRRERTEIEGRKGPLTVSKER